MQAGHGGCAESQQAHGVVLFVYGSPDRSLARALRQRGLRVHSALSPSEAIVRAKEGAPSCVVVDAILPGSAELEFVSDLKAVAPSLRVVLLASVGCVFAAVEAMRRGATDYLLKPVEADQLLGAAPTPAEVATSPQRPLPTLERMQWEYIHNVLNRCDGNISEAARHLGVYRQSLQRMLRRHPPSR